MEEAFILQVSLEMGLGGGSECVAYELHRAWLALGVRRARVHQPRHRTRTAAGNYLCGALADGLGHASALATSGALIAVPLFTLLATWRAYRTRGAKIILSHGDSLIGDVCVVHAVNRASLAEKRRAGYYSWLLNPSNLWVTWRDWWMLGGGRYRRIVAISERVRTQLKEHYHVPDERIVTIPNGINLSRFDPANAQRESGGASQLWCSR